MCHCLNLQIFIIHFDIDAEVPKDVRSQVEQ